MSESVASEFRGLSCVGTSRMSKKTRHGMHCVIRPEELVQAPAEPRRRSRSWWSFQVPAARVCHVLVLVQVLVRADLVAEDLVVSADRTLDVNLVRGDLVPGGGRAHGDESVESANPKSENSSWRRRTESSSRMRCTCDRGAKATRAPRQARPRHVPRRLAGGPPSHSEQSGLFGPKLLPSRRY